MQGAGPSWMPRSATAAAECVKICPANVFTSFSGGKARGIEVVTEKTFRAREGA